MQISPASPAAPSIRAAVAARSPQRGDWPFTVEPPKSLSEAEFAKLMELVPDRGTTNSLVGTPDQAARWTAYSLWQAAEAGAQMQKGIDKDPAGFRDAVHGAADYARLALPGLHAWLRTDVAKSFALERFDAATRTLADIGTRFTYDKELRERIGNDDLAQLVRQAAFAANDVLKLLVDAKHIRVRPQG